MILQFLSYITSGVVAADLLHFLERLFLPSDKNKVFIVLNIPFGFLLPHLLTYSLGLYFFQKLSLLVTPTLLCFPSIPFPLPLFLFR